MKKFGPAGTKWVKILHLLFVALWFGGVMCMVVLRSALQLSGIEEARAVYGSMKLIDDYLIRNGAQGILLTSLIYGICTNWGFFRYRWVAVKWIIFIGQMLFGIIFLNRWVEGNIALLKTQGDLALANPTFLHNNLLIYYGVLTQIALIIFVVCISVLKPWKKKAANI